LNLVDERVEGLAQVSARIGEGVANVRAHNADIGNRLFAMMRAWEKSLYGFMQVQQLSTYTYLELIESNILRRLVSIESNVLAPMLEQVFKGNIEAVIGRSLSERIYLELLEQPNRLGEQNAKSHQNRNEQLLAALREYLRNHNAHAPRPTNKPAVTPEPV
jgi:hypothetical protein